MELFLGDYFLLMCHAVYIQLSAVSYD